MNRNFRAADAAETDTFSAVVVQDFDSVAVEDANYPTTQDKREAGVRNEPEECESKRQGMRAGTQS
jgi:hypothetical protein